VSTIFYDPGNDKGMSRDQPLLHFYHKGFLASNGNRETDKTAPFTSEAKLTHEGQIAQVNGVKIRFHRCVASQQISLRKFHKHNGTCRTIRVPGMLHHRFQIKIVLQPWPDNQKTHALPPDMGPFELL
jgi:hypothetical protein